MVPSGPVAAEAHPPLAGGVTVTLPPAPTAVEPTPPVDPELEPELTDPRWYENHGVGAVVTARNTSVPTMRKPRCPPSERRSTGPSMPRVSAHDAIWVFAVAVSVTRCTSARLPRSGSAAGNSYVGSARPGVAEALPASATMAAEPLIGPVNASDVVVGFVS